MQFLPIFTFANNAHASSGLAATGLVASAQTASGLSASGLSASGLSASGRNGSDAQGTLFAGLLTQLDSDNDSGLSTLNAARQALTTSSKATASAKIKSLKATTKDLATALKQTASLAVDSAKATSRADIQAVEESASGKSNAELLLDGLSLLDAAAASAASGDDTDSSLLDTLKQSLFDSEDFSQIKDALRGLGFTESDLEEMEQLLETDGGLTWNAFLEQLSAKIAQFEAFSALELGTSETRHLQSLFQEMGLTPQQADEIIDDLSQGNLDKVWTALNQQLAALPKKSLNIRQEDLQTLVKVLKLSEEASERVTQLFSQLQSDGLTKNEMKNLLATIRQEVDKQDQALETKLADLGEALGTTLREALSGATDEKAQEQQAKWIKAKADDSTQRTALEQVESDSTGKASAIRASQSQSSGDSGQNSNASRGESNQQADLGTVETDTGQDTLNQNNQQQSASRDAQGQIASSQTSKKSTGEKESSDKEQRGKSADTILSQLTSKISVAANSTAEAPLSGGEQSTQATQAPRASISSQQVFQQVQNGILQSLNNGAKQLSLQLDPPELGSLLVTVSVSNKEVNAVIKTENPETTKVITEQMHQIREILEQQGLKVQRLEVQTQTQGERGANSWNGTAEHNLTQEQREAMEKSSFFRKLSGKQTEVVQEMQTPTATATLASGGLYIIA